MKYRTCPNCGYKYSFLEYYRKFIFKFIDSKWECASCGSSLTFSVGRRTLLAIISMVPLAFSHLFFSYFLNNQELSKGISFFLVALVFILWVLIIYSFDSFELIKKKE
jgi:CXXC-20-CXXC protein